MKYGYHVQTYTDIGVMTSAGRMEWLDRIPCGLYDLVPMPMKQHLSLLILAGLLLAAIPAQCQQLTIQTQDGKQTVLARPEIESLPHVKVTTHTSDVSATFEGVALNALLEKAGVEFGHSMRGKHLASCLLVEAEDGYRAVIALPELDPDFTDKQVILAYVQDGKPLDRKAGRYRIVIPDEKRMARWVRQVTTLKIVDVP